jgi:hypothetical protein
MISLLLAAAATIASTADLPAFLTGCWEHRDGDRWTQECWTDPRAGQMMGSGRSGEGDKLRNWEWMRIVRGNDGAIVFLGSPGGAAPTPFRALEVTTTAAEFTNPAHDYPQRIRYELKDGQLEAEVSLIDGSKAERWRYRRAGSPAAANKAAD